MSRIRRPAVLTAGILGLLTAVSMAFFIGSFMADGTHTGTTGSGGTGTKTLPITVDFPDGQLTPTKSVPLTATVSNTTTKTIAFKHLTPTITTGTAGCLPKWFAVSASTPFFTSALAGSPSWEVEYAPGTSPLGKPFGAENEAKFTLEMVETSVDQSACEFASVTVALKLTE